MATWHLRSPETFPVLFSDIILASAKSGNPELLKVCRLKSEARRYLDKFRYFRWCLREGNHTNHRVWEIENEKTIKTFLKFNPEIPGYQIFVHVKSKLLSDELISIVEAPSPY